MKIRAHGGRFDSTDPNPVASAAAANFAKSPIAQLGSSFNVPGGLLFANPNNNAIYQNTSHLVSPRIAWREPRQASRDGYPGWFRHVCGPVTIASLA